MPVAFKQVTIVMSEPFSSENKEGVPRLPFREITAYFMLNDSETRFVIIESAVGR